MRSGSAAHPSNTELLLTRYLAWSRPGPDEHTVVTDYAYLLRSADGTIRVEHDQHLTGRLPTATWCETLEATGFFVQVIPLVHSGIEPGRHHVFVSVK